MYIAYGIVTLCEWSWWLCSTLVELCSTCVLHSHWGWA